MIVKHFFSLFRIQFSSDALQFLHSYNYYTRLVISQSFIISVEKLDGLLFSKIRLFFSCLWFSAYLGEEMNHSNSHMLFNTNNLYPNKYYAIRARSISFSLSFPNKWANIQQESSTKCRFRLKKQLLPISLIWYSAIFVTVLSNC